MDADFHATVQAHKDRLFGLAVHLTGDRAEAEDVVQEAFIKYWRQGSRINSASALPWLLTVTRNASLDRLRRRRLVPVDEQTLAQTESPQPGPDASLMQDEFHRRLQRAIQALEEPYRSLVWLRDVQELDYATIAQTLALSLAQVKVYLHRARRQLRHTLSNDEHG